MEQEINGLIEHLKALLPHLGGLQDVEAQHEAAKADLAATKTQLETTKAELGKATAGLTSAQVIAQKKHDEDIYAKQQELKALATKLADATQRLGTLEAEINSKQLHHDQILASLNSLRAKLS